MYKVHTHVLAFTYGLALHTILCGRFADRPNACPPPLRPVQSGAYDQYTPPPTHTHRQPPFATCCCCCCVVLLPCVHGIHSLAHSDPKHLFERETRQRLDLLFHTHTHALSDQCARNRVDAGRSPGAHSHTSHMCVPVMAHHKRSVY